MAQLHAKAKPEVADLQKLGAPNRRLGRLPHFVVRPEATGKVSSLGVGGHLTGVMKAEARFDAIYREHAGAVRRYVRRRCDADSTDDVVADVFVVAWRRLGEVPDDPLPWLLGVARRVLANRYREDARGSALDRRMRSEQVHAQPLAEADRPEPGAVWRALSVLSERDREVLLLVAWEGLSSARAARVLGVSANTFAVRLYRARRRFARELEHGSAKPGRRIRSATREVVR